MRMKPMILVKAHSEAVLAAHVFHGWAISSVHRDAASDEVSEHVLKWTLPKPPRRPSPEEIQSFIHLSDVEDLFVIQERGIVIAPGLPRDKAGFLKHGDVIVLHDYAESAFVAKVRCLELFSPPSPRGWGILLSEDHAVSQIRIGMQVWARKRNNTE